MITRLLTALRARARILGKRARAWPPGGFVRFGSFGSTDPISRVFGTDRGGSIDRIYIEDFLAAHSAQVRGRVLEFGDDGYTRRFGGDAVTRGDVVHPIAAHPGATVCGDLVSGEGFPSGAYDCVICTQVLQYVFDLRAAVATLHRSLAEGGVLLGSVPVVSMASPGDAAAFGEYWRFTSEAVRRLLTEQFDAAAVQVEAFGNVLVATAFLQGLGRDELTPRALAAHDPAYEVVVTFRAVRRAPSVPRPG